MAAADAHKLACVKGTSFGREVVPEVWSKRATSSGRAGPPVVTGKRGRPSTGPNSRKAPAAWSRQGDNSINGRSALPAAARTGDGTPS